MKSSITAFIFSLIYISYVCFFSEDPNSNSITTEKLSNLKLSNQLLLSQIHASKFHFQSDSIEVITGELFHPNLHHGIVACHLNDSIIGVYIYQRVSGKWNLVFQKLEAYYYSMIKYSHLIELTDYSNDKIPELYLITNFSDIHFVKNGSLFKFNKNEFSEILGFSELINPSFSQKDSLIVSYEADGCADYDMYISTYRLKKHTLSKENQWAINCCNFLEEKSSCTTCEVSLGNDANYSSKSIKEIVKFLPESFKDAIREKLKKTKD